MTSMLRCDAGRLPLGDETVDAIVTSPPYNVGLAYDGVDDALPWDVYVSRVEAWAAEMHRVLKGGGRCWVNVAAQTDHDRDGDVGRRRNLAGMWCDALDAGGLWYRDTVVWDKRSGNNSTAWGSKLSPNAPNLRGRWEPVLLYFKEHWSRGRVEPNDLTMGDFLEATRNVWAFGTAAPNGHPAPFPAEIPRRAILLSTWPGDIVLDPFAGSGTTVRVAHGLGRVAVGCDLSEAYCRRAMTRGFQGGFDFAASFPGASVDAAAGEAL